MTEQSRGLRVGRKQCCDILGWTKHQFDKNVRAGMPTEQQPTSRGGDYVLYMGDVIGWLTEREVKAALDAAGMVPAEVINFDYEKARLTKEQADKTELENKLARKELLPAADVARTYETAFTVLRDRVMAVRSVAPQLHDAALDEGLPKVRSVLDEALREALDETGALELEEVEDAA